MPPCCPLGNQRNPSDLKSITSGVVYSCANNHAWVKIKSAEERGDALIRGNVSEWVVKPKGKLLWIFFFGRWWVGVVKWIYISPELLMMKCIISVYTSSLHSLVTFSSNYVVFLEVHTSHSKLLSLSTFCGALTENVCVHVRIIISMVFLQDFHGRKRLPMFCLGYCSSLPYFLPQLWW